MFVYTWCYDQKELQLHQSHTQLQVLLHTAKNSALFLHVCHSWNQWCLPCPPQVKGDHPEPPPWPWGARKRNRKERMVPSLQLQWEGCDGYRTFWTPCRTLRHSETCSHEHTTLVAEAHTLSGSRWQLFCCTWWSISESECILHPCVTVRLFGGNRLITHAEICPPPPR